MAERKKPASREKSDGFTAEERAAMKERAQELKSAKRGGKSAEDESALVQKIAEMGPTDRALAERLHALMAEVAPQLAPKTWYGMPAYNQDGKAVCFFQPADKFKARYATLGFGENARLDDGVMWPTSFALVEWTPEVEERVRELVRRAVG